MKSSQQLAAHGGLVDAVGHADGVQRPQPLALRRQQRQSHRLEAAPRAPRGGAGAGRSAPRAPPPRLPTAPRRSAYDRAARRACGDTCAAASSPRAATDPDRSCATGTRAPRRARREGDRGQARTARPGPSASSCSRRRCPARRSSTGMPPREVTASTTVSAPCARAIAHHVRHRVQDAGRRLRLHHRDDVGRRAVASAARTACGIAGAAPLDVDPRHVRAVALEDLRQPRAEVAGHHHQHLRARRGDVGDRRLHPRRAGARHRNANAPLPRAEHAAQLAAHLVQDPHHLGIEMAQNGVGHRAHDARGNGARAGPEKQAFRNHWTCGSMTGCRGRVDRRVAVVVPDCQWTATRSRERPSSPRRRTWRGPLGGQRGKPHRGEPPPAPAVRGRSCAARGPRRIAQCKTTSSGPRCGAAPVVRSCEIVHST